MGPRKTEPRQMRVFAAKSGPGKGVVCREEEAIFCGTDRGVDSAGGDFRADFLSVEEAAREAGDRSGAAVEAVAGRESAIEAIGGGPDFGQDHAAGRAGKKFWSLCEAARLPSTCVEATRSASGELAW